MGPRKGGGVTAQPELSLARLYFCCMVAGGVQYGWALQLSLLTPYVQTLGIPHYLASITWLCGPISGLLVAPTVGLLSDRSRSRFGRRRPFILAGCITICVAVILIGFSSDIGSALGDTMESCSTYIGPRWKAAIIYVVGFWVLDFANNVVQGPTRAMMADLSGKHGCNAGNIIYAFWMAFGNVLGYLSGAIGGWYKWFPFLMTNACCEACANLKGAFLVAVVFLSLCLTVSLICAKEVSLSELDPVYAWEEYSGFLSLLKAFKRLPVGMLSVLLVTSLTWMAWFPFLLYDTDWMGREIYRGDPNGTKIEIDAYNNGVQHGAFGLLLNSIVLGVSSIFLEPICRKFTSRIVWVLGNFTLFIAMVAIAVLSLISKKLHTESMSTVFGELGVKIGALVIFAALGFPLAILFSIPFASAAQLAANEGGTKQGLCIGILNISIVIPQVIVALGAGPWDAVFGTGNIPAFVLASAFALAGGFIALAVLPKPPKSSLNYGYGPVQDQKSGDRRRGKMDSGEENEISVKPQISLVRLIFACTVAGGVQYGWALQLSLLTPYVQTLGLPHSLASIMWLCGPVAGFVVGPSIGYWSDKCQSRFGRRRPFILAGCILICCCVLVIGFSSDIGSALGDTKENCRTYVGPRWKAAIIYVVGFWVLDFSNNAVQGPARAMMADLSGQHGCNAANIIYAFWMAFGNILGYSSGSTGGWHKWFPFLLTNSCCETCANLKGAFLVAIVFLLICLTVTLLTAKEVPLYELDPAEAAQGSSGIFSVFKTLKSLPTGMPSVLLVTSLTWLAWFPFILYDTDWMGREIYHGDPSGTREEIDTYNKGVEDGAFGLLLNSIVLAITSLLLAPMCRKLTSKVVWIIGNFILFLAMAAITVLSVISTNGYRGKIHSAVAGHDGVKIGALIIFAALGFPLAILYSIPFASASQLAVNEGGSKQGLCIGVLNVSIVLPQVIVALGAGPWDAIFGKGNIPAFALASGLALLGGFIGLAILPKLSGDSLKSSSFGSMH
ncbi:hypothetical protein IEQ34_027056 [Dendrobium chrysotoxum]|uniref:Sucrose transporter n=1 Tax=Dendrobium chrysotoxum TaxID=161865 RepID=A0AAV7FH49_DENCH|nr:hypothetical protein IEQ34_027056 [Dendrobium chrysotoxum]